MRGARERERERERERDGRVQERPWMESSLGPGRPLQEEGRGSQGRDRGRAGGRGRTCGPRAGPGGGLLLPGEANDRDGAPAAPVGRGGGGTPPPVAAQGGGELPGGCGHLKVGAPLRDEAVAAVQVDACPTVADLAPAGLSAEGGGAVPDEDLVVRDLRAWILHDPGQVGAEVEAEARPLSHQVRDVLGGDRVLEEVVDGGERGDGGEGERNRRNVRGTARTRK